MRLRWFEWLNLTVCVPLLVYAAVFWFVLVSHKGIPPEASVLGDSEGLRQRWNLAGGALFVDKSQVHGLGLFAGVDLPAGNPLGAADANESLKAVEFVPSLGGLLHFPRITPLGSFVNHGCPDRANVRIAPQRLRAFSLRDVLWDGVPGGITLVTTREVKAGEEIFQNYNEGPWFVGGAPSASSPCAG